MRMKSLNNIVTTGLLGVLLSGIAIAMYTQLISVILIVILVYTAIIIILIGYDIRSRRRRYYYKKGKS